MSVPIPRGFLEEWCDILAVDTEMPPEAYLATGLVSVAAIVGPRLFVRFSHTRRERCNLWVLNVGRSAMARKTTGMSAAKWACGAAENVLGDGLRWYGAKRLSDAQMAVDLDVVSADTAAARAAEKAAAAEEKREPSEVAVVRRRVPVAWVLALNELASLWGEGLRDWQQATQAFLLDIFDGELASNTRQTFVPAQETFVCALGNIPPAELTARTTLGMLTSGFAGRWVLLPSPGPVVPISFPALNGNDPMRALAERLRHLAGLASGSQGIDVRTLWTPEALEIRDVWYCGRWEELRQADPDSHEAAARADLYMRLQATAIKLATIVAVCRQGRELAHLHEVRVELADAAWAQERVEQSIRTLMDVVAETGGGSVSVSGKAENRVLHVMRRRGARDAASALTFRDIGTAAKGSSARRDVVTALESLAAMGAVEVLEIPPGPRGGRPGRAAYLLVE